VNSTITAVIAWLLFTAAALWADPGAALRQHHLGPEGLPSESAYLQAEGVAPAPDTETYAWQAVFKLTYLTADLQHLGRADPVATDCYFIRTRSYVSVYRALPVWDGRVYQKDDDLLVAAYTNNCEQVVGHVSADGKVVTAVPGNARIPLLGLKDINYNPFTGQLWRRERGGIIVGKDYFYLPFPLVTQRGEPVRCTFEIVRQQGPQFALIARAGDKQALLATCVVSDQTLISKTDGYAPKLAPGCVMATAKTTTVLEVQGQIADDTLHLRGAPMVLTRNLGGAATTTPQVKIDGDFSEWRNVPCGAAVDPKAQRGRGGRVGDPRGDIPGYLRYNPDTDLLEFKVANDATHLYFYTRVAGRHGNTVKPDGRYYFYVYIDADRNTATGYIPTRDDTCYYGVTIGDDCEAQFEFVGGRFVKTFFGFTGAGTEKEVLAGRVKLGPSWYSREDSAGRTRDRYKVEYVKRNGKLQTTGDYTEGTSDDIVMALSPDGSECEMSVELAGFLRDQSGKQIIAPGQSIDLAAGAEASRGAWGNRGEWGADSTAPIYGYYIAPSPEVN
jgi:hypothetical protein